MDYHSNFEAQALLRNVSSSCYTTLFRLYLPALQPLWICVATWSIQVKKTTFLPLETLTPPVHVKVDGDTFKLKKKFEDRMDIYLQ